jgi:hypothetical protein
MFIAVAPLLKVIIKTPNYHQSSCIRIAIISYLRSDHAEAVEVFARLASRAFKP